MRADLCGKCAAGLQALNLRLDKLGGKAVKNTCDCCRRRRFCTQYDTNYYKFRKAVKQIERENQSQEAEGRK